MPKIFISYRRADSAETVNRLYDRLVYAFGRENVFKDLDTLQRGDDFPEVLHHWVTTCDVFLSVIGQRWLTVQDEAGRRRLDNPNDWVRQETEMALGRSKNCMLIPTIVDGAVFPKIEHLPDSLASLTNRNSQILNPQRFHEDVSSFVAFLRHQFHLIPPLPAVDYDKALRDLVDMLKINDVEAARDILAAMRGQGSIPPRIRLDAIEQGLYHKVHERERDLAYDSIRPLADLANSGYLPSEEVIAALEAFWQSFPDAVNYDPDDLARFRPKSSKTDAKENNVHHVLQKDDGNWTVSASPSINSLENSQRSGSAIIAKLEQLTSTILKILPPPFDWCFIPGGNVILETDPPKIYTIPDFAIAKYPITNAQFQVFIEARDGYMYEDHYGWYDFSSDARDYRSRQLRPKTIAFAGDNIPCTNVSWYDSIAFCRWLSIRIGQTITLPNEQQWQRAAIGDHNWQYPWGNKFNVVYCNTQESGIGHPVAVTEYPSGTSPYGVFQMSGNIYDWCLNNYAEPNDIDLASKVLERGVRGGSWKNIYTSTPCVTHRRDAKPTSNNNKNVGLRIVIPNLRNSIV